jgi:UDP-N-acetylglucosamine acyltransferase
MSEVHSTAVVAPGAELGREVSVGPFCSIGSHVKLGDGVRLVSHVAVEGYTTIGAGCVIFPFASLGSQSQDLKYRGDVTYVEIGERTTLREYVTVNSGTKPGEVTRVGAGCHIMAYCHVAHGCRVGDRVIMANGATLGGEVLVDDDAVLGGLCAAHQFCRVGRMSMVGGMTKVTQDCAPYTIVDGNPASVHGLNSVGMKRKQVPAENVERLKQAYRLVFREGLTAAQAVERIKAEVGACEEVREFTAFVETTERGLVR